MWLDRISAKVFVDLKFLNLRQGFFRMYEGMRRSWVLHSCYEMPRGHMKYTCICICLEIKLQRFTKFNHVRGHVNSWPIFCRVGTLDLDSIWVETRSIFILPFKIYKGKGRTDGQTDFTDIHMKCSSKSRLITAIIHSSAGKWSLESLN